MSPTLDIRLLGGFSLHHNDAPVEAIRSPRQQALLAFLVLHGQVPQSRRFVAFTFWPDSAERRARNNLRKALYNLRQTFTAQGLQGMLKEGSTSRVKVVEQLLSGMSARLEVMYFAFGSNDFVSNAADPVTTSGGKLAGANRGEKIFRPYPCAKSPRSSRRTMTHHWPATAQTIEIRSSRWPRAFEKISLTSRIRSCIVRPLRHPRHEKQVLTSHLAPLR